MSIDPTKYSDPNYFKVSLKTPMAIAIAGGADSGKKAFCDALTARINKKYHARVALISLTQFYRELTPEERRKYETGNYYTDHPNAFDFKLLENTLKSLLSGKPTSVPEWDSSNHTRMGTYIIEPVDVILIEGTLLLYQKEITDLMFMKVFIDEDSDERLARRVRKKKIRNGKELSLKEILMDYVDRVKPMYEEYILPTKKFADIVIPRGAENTIALQVMTNRVEEYLDSRHEDKKEATVNPGAAEILAQHINSSYKNIPK
ncbi:P-loop containing nucleoside triphosphate hydrolase protein [Rhizopus microsporus var. microsporus]|uniref:uridine/cytidine kinase n=2 Tax=Rhizopus microsporus TaxID=58291 RepID=A0A2G4T4L5_RHIZD|nr:putative uridine monophosphate kinase [Rhizopus microsporus ATCC 52813]ORE10160.1 P-loop containing nucleoside triphosphate hydrolase protein [Rhizopus microsporus var. microsporus]PHZ15964.1 putative uridine monophosphate kinase [Rhizopus microsporus ATCC 52813]